MKKVEKRFGYPNLQASLITKKEVIVGQESEIRLDLVNVSRTLCSVINVENIIPHEGFDITILPSYCQLQDGILKIIEGEISPFKVRTIKLIFLAKKPGVFTFSPKIITVDNFGKRKTHELKPICVIVNPTVSISQEY